ncbi:MAG: hypothetical protein JEZ07_16970 [Phycisphaerae bacterium]|nr:hypothetical protein [Phycisphaerae bacterium]
MTNKSLKHNASWAIGGNVFFAVGRLLIIMFLAKAFGKDSATVGRFMFAIAVATPLAVLFNLESRSVYVTDARDEISIGHYFSLRIISNIFYLIAMAIICMTLSKHWGKQKTILVMLMGGVRAAESICDIFLSVLQKKEQMKYWAVSQSLKTGSVLVLAAAIWIFDIKHIWIIPVGWLIMTAIVGYCFDHRKASKFTDFNLQWDHNIAKKILNKALPMGLFVTLSSFNSQIGQYFIEWRLTDQHVAYFGAMLHFMAGPMAIQNGFNQALLPRLAKYYHENLTAFIVLLTKLIVISSIAMAGMLVIFHFWAADILTLIYTEEYAAYSNLLFLAGIAGCFILFSMILGDAVIAAQRFKGRLLAIIVGLAINIAICTLVNETRGIEPAAYAMAAGALAVVIVCAIVLGVAIGQMGSADADLKGNPNEKK